MAATKDTNMQQDRQKALENAMKQITKEFGAGSIMRLGEMGDKLDIEVIPTGSLALDIAVGVGGYPRGRVIEIYGPESSGKTTLALHAIAEAQKMGGITAFIDAEHALDPVYAHHLGVDTKELLISQPDSGEQALSIAESLVRSGAVDMIVIDSVAALVPKQEIEGDISDASVGLQARLMSKALRKLTGIISKSKTIVIFINQLREKGRRDVRQSGNHHRRPCAEILLLHPHRDPQARSHQERLGHHRQPHKGEGREEQSCSAIQSG